MKTHLTRGAVVLVGVLTLASFWYRPAEKPEEQTAFVSPAVLLAQEPGFLDGSGVDGSDIEEPGELPTLLDDADYGSGDLSLSPIDIADAEQLVLGIYSDAGYQDAEGRYIVDLLEQDYAYLTLIVTDADGRPVIGAEPSFTVNGKSEILPPEDVATRTTTDASGTVDFAIIGGEMALDQAEVSVGDATMDIRINVISLAASGFPALPDIDGVVPWQELMKARIRYEEDSVSVDFPAAVQEAATSEVLLTGFMMPLEPEMVQRRFLLTSNPPSCFFHIPGGPAGAVEVFAPEGIEASLSPMVMAGRLELLETMEFGVIYRLQDAKLVQP